MGAKAEGGGGMEENGQKDVLCGQLDTVNESLLFLLLIIFSVLLSLWSVLIQRGQLVDTICGDTEAAAAAPPVFPIKCASGAIVIGALGFFLSLAMTTLESAAQGDDCVAKRSAQSNVWASILVLAAALIRFCDLHYVERCQKALLEQDDLPD